MSDQLDTKTGWLSPDQMESIRANVPLVYIDAVPVRVDSLGRVTHIGLLLRVAADGTISRMVVSGRVMFGERIRDALIRHLEKDLGPVALPRVPTDPAPFTIIEYFPDPDISGFHDPRHHAVSLAYVVPVDGDCTPTQQALDLAWFTPTEAVGDSVRRQMTGGHDRLIRLALAHVGELPSARPLLRLDDRLFAFQRWCLHGQALVDDNLDSIGIDIDGLAGGLLHLH